MYVNFKQGLAVLNNMPTFLRFYDMLVYVMCNGHCAVFV